MLLVTMNLGKVHLLAGCPPCQGFSTVGSKNVSDLRNDLFHEFLRAVAELDPEYVLFENVSGFKRMYSGEAYKTLTIELNNLGYDFVSDILNTCEYGIPQKRLRTILIGWKKNLNSVKLPEKSNYRWTLMDAISDIPALSNNDIKYHYECDPLNDYQEMLRGTSDILIGHDSSNYGVKMIDLISKIPIRGSVQDLAPEFRPKSCFKNCYARLDPDEPAPTITRNFGTPSSSRCIHPVQNRALSTFEGARLQSFPDDYIFIGSKTSKNIQIGNAVPPLLGKAIGLEIMKNLQKKT